MQLINGECLEEMAKLPDASIDAIITDPPYGTTACKWDSVIPFEPMWAQLKRIIKPRGAIVLFGSQPFTSALIMSNVEWFKYCWVWEKEQSHSPLNAPYQPLKIHEDIIVFSGAASTYSPVGSMVYYPIMESGTPYITPVVKTSRRHKFHGNIDLEERRYNAGLRYPTTVFKFPTERGQHPTQKPVRLMEYLVKTYTLEGETVLDFTIGSGSTGVACKNTGREFIGIELDEGYYQIAQKRIAAAVRQLEMF